MGGRGASAISGSGVVGNRLGYGQPNEATDFYVEDGYYINNILRNGIELDDKEKEYVKELDKATNGTVKQDTLYRVIGAETIFDGMTDFDYEDMRAHLILGDDAYDKGAYSQGKKAKMESMLKSAVGKTTTDKGYMSTTKDENIAFEKAQGTETHGQNRVVMKLNNVKGKKGIDISDTYDKKYSFMEPEKEVLLARNQRYTIKKIYEKNGQIYVEADMK